MKKADIKVNLQDIFFSLKDKCENESGMTKEETKELFDKVYYLFQQINL